MGFGIQRLIYMAEVLFVRRAVLRKRADPILLIQCRHHVILGGERIGSGQGNLRAAGLQGAHEVGGFRRDMEARGEANTL